MLIEGRVVVAGGQYHNSRILNLGGLLQGIEQHSRIEVNRPDVLREEELRIETHHYEAVLQHVGDARRCPHVVLEDIVVAVTVPHEVRSDDVRVHSAWEGEAGHDRRVEGVPVDSASRDDALLDDLAVMVDIVEEQVEGLRSLGKSAADLLPLGRGDDSRKRIKGNKALRSLAVAVNVESNADAVEQKIRSLHSLLDRLLGHAVEPLAVALVRRPAGTVIAHHLIKRSLLGKFTRYGHLCCLLNP